jgi:protein-tyrosine phosphatase
MDKAMTQMAEDEPALTGAHNFRDIGGHATLGGQRVARGKLFRSGTLAALTDADHAVLDRLGIRVVCDLRSTRERASRPSRFAETASFTQWSRDHETSAGDLVRALAAPGADAQMSRRLMIEAYRTLPYEQAESYGEMFRRIAANDLPLVFHCSAGKDRTGIAAALLLDVLGVPRATVVADYVATDRFIDELVTIIQEDPSWGRLGAVPTSVWEPMVRADPVYIETMFATVEQAHGSAAGFLRDEAGLDDSAIEAVRRNLLTPA